MLTVLASAAGPLVFAYTKEKTASYTFIFHMMAAVVLAMAFVAWFTPLPRFEHQPPKEQLT